MKIGLFTDSDLTDAISKGNTRTNPDSIVADGEAGEVVEDHLYLANYQTTLTAGMNLSTTELHVTASDFFDIGDILICGTEKMLITAGSGQDYTVTRAYNGTTAGTHSIGDRVYAAYDFTAVELSLVDSETPSSVTLITLATTQLGLDAATAGAALALSDKAYNVTLDVWRRVTIPASTDTGLKTSVSYKLTRTEHETS